MLDQGDFPDLLCLLSQVQEPPSEHKAYRSRYILRVSTQFMISFSFFENCSHVNTMWLSTSLFYLY